MAISLLDNFSLGAKKPNFARDLFNTVADMAAFSENYLPDVFECNVKENGNRYRYNVNNTVDSTTGKWRLVDGGGGSDLPEVINNRFLHTNADTGELEWSTIEAGNNIIEQYDELPAATFDEYNNKIIFNKYDHEFYINFTTRSSFRKYTNSNNETIYIKEISSGEIVYILDRDDLLASTNYQLYVTEDYFGYYDTESNDHKFFVDDFESTDLYRYCVWELYRSYETGLPKPNNDDEILISYNNHWNQTSKEDFLSDKQDKLPDEGYGFLYKDSNTGEIEWVDNDKLKFRNTISSTDQPYLYTGHCYEKPNWEKINEFMEDKFLDGGCSGAVRNGKFYRSFDFLYNDTASFVIENHACGYKGMAGAKPEVTKTLIDNGGDDEWFNYLPFDLLDGINLSGIAVSTYILHREGDRTNQGDSKQKICTSVLATYLLCNLKDIDDLADVVDEICVYAPNSTEHPEFSAEYHWMITNGTKTVCLEYVNNSPVITDISANPYIANFYLYDWDGSDLSTTNAHAQGIERWNILKNGGSLEDIAYTHAYSLIGTANVWRSDFNDVWATGEDITTSTPDNDPDLLAVQAAAKSAWESRTRGNGTWHTQHACVYDFATRSFKVCTQEDYNTWYPNVYTRSETDALLSDKQNKLPTATNDKYLHTNVTTGELEWADANGLPVPESDNKILISLDGEWVQDDAPTKLSDFTNDEGFIDKTVDDLDNYYTETEVDDLLDGKQDALPTTVNDKYLHTNATTGALEWAEVINTDSYTKDETDALLDDKADKSTTYTKTEADGLLGNKADKSTTYTKTETDNLLANKADSDSVYTKTETDALLDDKVDKVDGKGLSENDYTDADKAIVDGVTDALDDKADKSTTYTKTEVDTLLDDKANSDDVYTQTETDDLLDAKQNKVIETTVANFDSAVEDAEDGDLINVMDASGGYDLNLPKTINQNWQGNGYNLLPFSYKDSGKTVNGITFTVNADGSITANGTATTSMWFNVIEHNDMPIFEIGKTYRLSGCPSGGGATSYFIKPRNAGGVTYDTGNGYIFTHSADITDYLVTIRFNSGVVCDNVVFKPMIVEVDANGNYPTEYQRYAMGNIGLTDKVSNIQEPIVVWENCTPLSEGTSFQAKNGVAYLSAHLNNISITANTWKSFGIIPEGFRPNKADIRFPILIDGTTKACKGHITSTGVIGIYSSEAITESSFAFVFNLSYIIN